MIDEVVATDFGPAMALSIGRLIVMVGNDRRLLGLAVHDVNGGLIVADAGRPKMQSRKKKKARRKSKLRTFVFGGRVRSL